MNREQNLEKAAQSLKAAISGQTKTYRRGFETLTSGGMVDKYPTPTAKPKGTLILGYDKNDPRPPRSPLPHRCADELRLMAAQVGAGSLVRCTCNRPYRRNRLSYNVGQYRRGYWIPIKWYNFGERWNLYVAEKAKRQREKRASEGLEQPSELTADK